MSGKIMGQVWDLELPHNKLIVLLAMADHADHDGKNVYPSVGLIAWKTGYSERTIRRIVSELVSDGLLVCVEEKAGHVKKYEIDLAAGVRKQPYKTVDTPDKMSEVDNDTPDTAMSPPPLTQLCHPTPDTAMSPEPSIKPSVITNNADAGQKVIPITGVTGKAVEEDTTPEEETTEEQSKDTNTVARGLIAVYLKTTGAVNGSAYKFWMKEAQQLAEAGITPKHVAAWVKDTINQDWWSSGTPTWKLLCQKIVNWRDEYERKQEQAQVETTPDTWQQEREHAEAVIYKIMTEGKAS